MADLSIANLPAFVGSGFDPADLVVVVDTSDTSESPLGTTKRGTFGQLANPGTSITATPNLIVTGTPPATRGLVFQTATSATPNRWYISIDGAESGGDVGGDLAFRAYSDSGSAIDIPISIARKAGSPIILARPLNASSVTVSGLASVGGLTVTTAIGQINLPGAANGVILFGGTATLYQDSNTNTNIGAPSGKALIVLPNEVFHGDTTTFIRISGGNAAGVGANLVVFGPSHPTAANLLQLNATGGIAVSNTTPSFIIGNDPGGTDLFRVGGSGRMSALSIDGGTGVAGFTASWVAATGAFLQSFATRALHLNNLGNDVLIGDASSTHVVIGTDPGGTATLRVGGAITTNATLAVNGGAVTATIASNGGYAGTFSNSATTTPFGVLANFNGAAPNNSSSVFFAASDTATVRFEVLGNGGIGNYSANNINLSDATIKTIGPLIDPALWWDRIAALEIRAFKYVDQTHDDDNIGLIAQQVEQVAPELVCEMEWGDRHLKGIYSADLDHAHLAVTQELQRRVLALEAKLYAH